MEQPKRPQKPDWKQQLPYYGFYQLWRDERGGKPLYIEGDAGFWPQMGTYANYTLQVVAAFPVITLGGLLATVEILYRASQLADMLK